MSLLLPGVASLVVSLVLLVLGQSSATIALAATATFPAVYLLAQQASGAGGVVGKVVSSGKGLLEEEEERAARKAQKKLKKVEEARKKVAAKLASITQTQESDKAKVHTTSALTHSHSLTLNQHRWSLGCDSAASVSCATDCWLCPLCARDLCPVVGVPACGVQSEGEDDEEGADGGEEKRGGVGGAAAAVGGAAAAMTKTAAKKAKKEAARKAEEERLKAEVDARKKAEEAEKKKKKKAAKKEGATPTSTSTSTSTSTATAQPTTSATDSPVAGKATAAALSGRDAAKEEGGWEVQKSDKPSASKAAGSNKAKAAAASSSSAASASSRDGRAGTTKGGPAGDAESKDSFSSPSTSSASGGGPDAYEEMYIPFKHHAQLIGSKGAVLQQLQQGTGAKIDMPKKDSGSTKVQLTGSADAVKAAKGAIESLIGKGYSTITHPGWVHDDVTVEERHFGLIIGPGGTHIQQIQQKVRPRTSTPHHCLPRNGPAAADPAVLCWCVAGYVGVDVCVCVVCGQTGTRINLPEKESGSTKVVIVGKKEDVRSARLAIKELIQDGFSPLTHDNYVKREVAFPKDKLHVLIGAKGQTIKSIQGNSKAKVNIPDRGSGPAGEADVKVSIVGTPEAVAQAEKEISRLLIPVQVVEEEPEEEYVNGTWAQSGPTEDELWE